MPQNDYDSNPSPEQLITKLRVAASSWHEGTMQAVIAKNDIVTRLTQAADIIERLSVPAEVALEEVAGLGYATLWIRLCNRLKLEPSHTSTLWQASYSTYC